MMEDFNVSLSPREAINRLSEAVRHSVTGEKLDEDTVYSSGEKECIVAVYEKHFFRVSNRLTLTVIASNLDGVTRIHAVSGGGESVLFRFDWGAADRFAAVVSATFAPDRI